MALSGRSWVVLRKISYSRWVFTENYFVKVSKHQKHHCFKTSQDYVQVTIWTVFQNIFWLTYCGLTMPFDFAACSGNWFGKCFVACLAPFHLPEPMLAYCQLQTPTSTNLANLNQIATIYNDENRFENVVCLMAAILSGVHFLSLAWSKLRLCSANNRSGYWSNLPCDWPITAWAYSK